MIVSFDGKRAVSNTTGLGNYSRRVISSLAQKFSNDEYVILAPKMKHSSELDELLKMDNVRIDISPHPKLGHIWRSGRGILKSAAHHHTDVFHGLSAELPIGVKKSGIASVVTIHDMIYYHYPKHYSLVDRSIYYRKALYACRASDRIVTVSEFTKKDVVNILGIDPKIIEVVYPCIGEEYLSEVSSASVKELRETLKLPERYVLAVGRLVYHKNLILAIESLSLLEDNDVVLVIVGKENSYWRNEMYPIVMKYGLADRIRLLPWVDSRLMPALYAEAQAVVFPSFCEGFGLPVLEAHHCGTPVLCATGSALDEVGGDAAVFFDPHDAKELAAGLDNILADKSLAKAMSDKGRINASRFTPDRMAEQLHAIYEQILLS
ncbi:MAG: glycosyltransferase family 4 protein [Muribaculaceae bacterium]|nr:glycosyltransferase family 4 protein [Muribaculaceae bacterium]